MSPFSTLMINLFAWVVVGMLITNSGHAGAPTFQDLMKPEVFPRPQRGMVVESAISGKESLSIVTTGARIDLNTATGEILFQQRIGHERQVARLRLGAPLQGMRLVHRGAGFAMVSFDHPKLAIRVNGDSLFMLHVQEALNIEVDRLIDIAWDASFQTNHLLVDEWGGFGLYCSEEKLVDHYDSTAKTVVSSRLPEDAVLWVGVCPPKPYDWDRSLNDTVVWHWSDKLAYPPDDVLKSWTQYGNIAMLQSEFMLWKQCNLDFVPRLGPEELVRVVKTIHDLDMRLMIYTSPFYFYKGTSLEQYAVDTIEEYFAKHNANVGVFDGENIDLFMDAITRVVRKYKPDGLYFDGQYRTNPAALYMLARRTRALLGEEGILEWHSTNALGDRDCYLPQADAYVDYVLRGETMENRYKEFKFLRFFVSGYNIHNSIGVLCNNMSTEVSSKLMDDVLKANARFHYWLGREDLVKGWDDYQSRLTSNLRKSMDEEVDVRQEQVERNAVRRQEELAILAQEPSWDQPVFHEDMQTLMAHAKHMISPKNGAPFTVINGSLQIRAFAHTTAFVSLPLEGEVQGLVVKIRQGTDGGMSWGPGVALRFVSGAFVRVGTRSDKGFQADALGAQFVGNRDPSVDWVWLRIRWLRHSGVVESSYDGKVFQRMWTFDHYGVFNEQATEVLLGKVPYSGITSDYIEAGHIGECEIGSISVY